MLINLYYVVLKGFMIDWSHFGPLLNLAGQSRSADFRRRTQNVPDPGKGVCADPVNGGATLGKGGPGPRGGNKERQLSPNKGRDGKRSRKTTPSWLQDASMHRVSGVHS